MSRGSGKGGSSRGKGNSRRHSRTSKSQKDQRSNSLNPNNRAHNKSGNDHRSNQMNPNNPAHDSSRQSSGSSGRWSQRMDAKGASRIQAHADKTDTNQDFKARAQSAAEKNEDEDS